MSEKLKLVVVSGLVKQQEHFRWRVNDQQGRPQEYDRRGRLTIEMIYAPEWSLAFLELHKGQLIGRCYQRDSSWRVFIGDSHCTPKVLEDQWEYINLDPEAELCARAFDENENGEAQAQENERPYKQRRLV